MWCLLVLAIFSLEPVINADVNCTQIGENYWTTVWSSEFDNETELIDLWDVQHETLQCSRNGIEQVNCNVRDNVQVLDGYAFMVAKHETYEGFDYTAATMTTRAAFSYGRYEIRARLPRGDFLRPSIFTRNDSETYWHDLGQFDLASYGQDAVLFRGVHYAHSSNKYQPIDLPFSSTPSAVIKLGEEFHLYGMEWSAQKFRYFWDNSFTKWFNFTESTPMTPWHHIRLQIGVGGITFPRKMPGNFSELNWICPALIVDYVRIYEGLNNDQRCDHIIINQDFADTTAETNKINSFCKTFQSEKSTKTDDKTAAKIAASFHLTQWIIAVMVVLFAVAIFWMMVQLRTVRRKLNTEPPANNDRFNGFNAEYSMPDMSDKHFGAEEETYEEINQYQFDGDAEPGRYMPYLPLEEIYKQNEYLQIHNIPDESNKNTLTRGTPAQNEYIEEEVQQNHNSVPHYDTLKAPRAVPTEMIVTSL